MFVYVFNDALNCSHGAINSYIGNPMIVNVSENMFGMNEIKFPSFRYGEDIP